MVAHHPLQMGQAFFAFRLHHKGEAAGHSREVARSKWQIDTPFIAFHSSRDAAGETPAKTRQILGGVRRGDAGGGGQHDLAPVTQGRLPKFAQEQIVPPKAPPTIPPKLAVDPTLVMQKDLKMANNSMPNLGLPNSNLPGVSLGTGSGGGIGSGNGNGLGPGSGGNMGGGVMHAGSAQVPPKLIYQVEPEFSEEARKAKFSGDVQVYLVVDTEGRPTRIRVARGVGMGLDEKAVEAVRQYKFKPAMQNGKPVKVDLYIDVNFQIF